MLQTEVFGQLRGITAWHTLPQNKCLHTAFLAEIKRLPDADIDIPTEFFDGGNIKKLTHRSMIQLASSGDNSTAFLIWKKEKKDESSSYYYSGLIFKEILSCNNTFTTIVIGARWKTRETDIKLKVVLNGKLIQQKSIYIYKCFCLEFDAHKIVRPGDLLEYNLQLHDKKIDRISVNFGARKTA